MADEETEDVEDKILGKKYLFPIISANNDDKKKSELLLSPVSMSYRQENGKTTEKMFAICLFNPNTVLIQ